MISLQQTKELLGEPHMDDEKAQKIRSGSYKLADLVIDKWLTEIKKIKNVKKKQIELD